MAAHTLDPTTQAYAELQAAYVHYNNALFDGKLPFCLITMQREKRTYGYFSSRRFGNKHDKTMTDEIAMNPSYFGVVPLLEILQTLVHEMAHLWQFHFGEPGRRGYHNKEWAEKMEAIGLMPSSTGKPGGKKTGERWPTTRLKAGRSCRPPTCCWRRIFAFRGLTGTRLQEAKSRPSSAMPVAVKMTKAAAWLGCWSR